MESSQFFQSATILAVIAFGVSLAVFHADLEEDDSPVAFFESIATQIYNFFFLTSTAGLSQNDVAAINDQLSKLPVREQPEAVLKWANATFAAGKWVQFTSFGLSGIAITHMCTSLGLTDSAPVISLDTLHLFPETYQLMEQFSTHFDLKDQLRIYRPKNLATREEFEQKFGRRLWRSSSEIYGYVTKVEPTKRALDEVGALAWITGRRRSQGGERSEIALVEIDAVDKRIKLNPMANWVHEEVFQYVKEHKLPYNPLHDQGYTSIGDVVSTEKAEDSDGERGGRFKGQDSKECGMHLSTDASSASKLERLAEKISIGYTWDVEAQERAKKWGIIQVTEESFEEVVGERPLLLEVYAPWCGHCRALERDWNKLAQLLREGGDQVAIARMDGWQNEVPAQYKEAFEGESVPRVYLLKPSTTTGAHSVELYDGEKEYADILAWVRERLAA